jgi:hypothetical protein
MFKKIIITLFCASFIMANTGCFGSFSLTKKVYGWNESIGDKWMQSVVLWIFCILPVYEAAGFIDVVVLNFIEFWTDSNPLALNAAAPTTKTFENNGKVYDATIGNGAIVISEIKGPDAGKRVILSLDKNKSSWTLFDGKMSHTIAAYNPKLRNTVDFYYPDGRTVSQRLDILETASLVRQAE